MQQWRLTPHAASSTLKWLNKCCIQVEINEMIFPVLRPVLPFLAFFCLLYLFLTMLFCLHSYCIHQILDSVSYAHQHDIVHRDLKVCVCLCVSLCCICPYPVCTDCSSLARAHCHLSVPVFQTCLCLLSVHLFVHLFFSRVSARHQALHLGLFLHCFGWSEAETRVLADIVLGCL